MMKNRSLLFILCILGLLSFISCIREGKEKQVIDTEFLAKGKQLYEENCLSCHQTNGTGVPGLYPPLVNSEWVTGNDERLILTVLEGVSGEIEVDGYIYSEEMPAQDYLTDDEIAWLLSYVRMEFGKMKKYINADQVKKLRNRGN